MRITPINTTSVYTCQNSKQQNFCNRVSIVDEKSIGKIINEAESKKVEEFFRAILDNLQTDPAIVSRVQAIKTSYRGQNLPTLGVAKSDVGNLFSAVVDIPGKGKVSIPFDIEFFSKNPDLATYTLLRHWEIGIDSINNKVKSQNTSYSW